MPKKTVLSPLSCTITLVVAVALTGCGDDDDGPSSSADETTTTAERAEGADVPADDGGVPRGDAAVLDGRDPCTIVDQATIGQIAGTEIVTAEIVTAEPTPSGPNAVGLEQCSYNASEPGVSPAFYFLPAEGHTPAEILGNPEDLTEDAITVPGADEASISRSEAHGQPEAMACAVVGDVLACAYTTDSSMEAAMDRLEPMATELVGRLVEAL